MYATSSQVDSLVCHKGTTTERNNNKTQLAKETESNHEASPEWCSSQRWKESVDVYFTRKQKKYEMNNEQWTATHRTSEAWTKSQTHTNTHKHTHTYACTHTHTFAQSGRLSVHKLFTSCIRWCLVSRACDWVMSALSVTLLIFSFQFSLHFFNISDARPHQHCGILLV